MDRPEVWDQVTGTALTEIDPWEDPGRTVSTLGLKGGAMARWMLDGLGREKAAALLAALRSRATGRTFDADDLLAAAQEAEVDLEESLGDWIDRPDLPGFVASEVRHVRLADEDGSPRYQVAFHLRNDEPAPGLIRLEYRVGEEPGANQNRAWERGLGAGTAHPGAWRAGPGGRSRDLAARESAARRPLPGPQPQAFRAAPARRG
jgi:hypothetical protein